MIKHCSIANKNFGIFKINKKKLSNLNTIQQKDSKWIFRSISRRNRPINHDHLFCSSNKEIITNKKKITVADIDVRDNDVETDSDDSEDDEQKLEGNNNIVVNEDQNYNMETYELKNKLVWGNSATYTLDMVNTFTEQNKKNLNRGSMRLVCSVLRTQLKSKKNSVYNYMDHPGMAQLTKSFLEYKDTLALQELTGILSFLSASEGVPEIMQKESLLKLENLIDDIDKANTGTILSLAKSMSNMKNEISVSIVRKLQDKVIRDLPEFTTRECIRIMNYFSVLEPGLSESVLSMFFDRISDNIYKLDQKSIYFLMKLMVSEMSPETTVKIQDQIYEKCIQLLPVMSASTLYKFMSWINWSHYVPKENFPELVQEAIMKKLRRPNLKTAEMLTIGYREIFGTNKEVIKALSDQLIYFKCKNNRAISNCFSMLINANKNEKIALKGLCELMNSQVEKNNISFFAYCVWEMAEKEFPHPVMNKICYKLSQSNTLSSADLIRTISSFVKLKIKPREMVLNFCKNLNIYDLDTLKTSHLTYFVDALLKIKLKDRYIAGGLLKTFENRYEKFEMSQKIYIIKGICLIGSPSQVNALIPTFENDIYKNIDNLPKEELAYLFELVGILENIQSIRLTNTVMSKVKEKISLMEPMQLSRILKWVGKGNIRDQKLLQFLYDACKNNFSNIQSYQCSWILWGFCKVEYEIDYEFIDNLANKIINDYETLNLHDLSRIALSLAKFRYRNLTVLDELANCIINCTDTKPDFPGISLISWAFASLSNKYLNIMKWTEENSIGILKSAHALSMANILWAFRKTNYKPSNEFIKEIKLQFNFKIDDMTPFEFGTILYGLLFYDEEGISKELSNKAIKYYELNKNQFDANSIACTTWCLVKLGYHPSKESIISSSLTILSATFNLDYENLGNFIWACGKSGFKPTPLLEETAPIFTKLADKLDPRVISSIINGFAACQYSYENMIKSMTESTCDRLEEFNGTQISNMVWGLASLNFQTRKYYQRVAEVAPNKIDEMNISEVVALFWAFAKAERPAKNFTFLALKRFSKEMGMLDIKQVTSLCWALGKTGMYDESVMVALKDKISSKIDHLDVKKISTVLWTYAALSHYPGEMVKLLLNNIGYGINKAFPGWLALTHVLWACAKFVEKIPEQVLKSGEELLERAESGIKWKGGKTIKGGVNSKHIWLCLWSLYVLELHETDLAKKIAKRINEVDILEGMNDEEIQDYVQCLMMCDMYGYTESALFEIPRHYQTESMSSYRAINKEFSIKQPSLFHRDITATIDSLSLKYEEKVIIENRMHILEIWIPNPFVKDMSEEEKKINREGIAIELYGPMQTINNTNKPNGKALLKTKLIKHEGFKVIEIIYKDWMDMKNDNHEKQNYLLNLIKLNGIDITDDMIKELVETSFFDEEEEDAGKWIDDYKDEFDEDDAMREIKENIS